MLRTLGALISIGLMSVRLPAHFSISLRYQQLGSTAASVRFDPAVDIAYVEQSTARLLPTACLRESG